MCVCEVAILYLLTQQWQTVDQPVVDEEEGEAGLAGEADEGAAGAEGEGGAEEKLKRKR